MTRLLVALLAAAGLIVAVFASATPAFAEHTGPLVDPDIETYNFPGDNPDCDDLVDDGFIDSYDDEDKFDPGTTSDGEHSSIVNTDEVISFEADEGWLVVAAIIKGGNEGAAVYVYADGVDHDNGLTTPTQQGVSHVTLCLIEDSATPTPTPATPTPTPEGSQAGGTGTPAPSVPDTATSLPGMAGPLATVVFGLILLGSLGALAYANVSAVRRRS